ncbi:MAG TPA: TorF family putative porin [Patescibacteria group bacterium]|nr:TorF family putative porin [Patescibacteria group bacterium]
MAFLPGIAVAETPDTSEQPQADAANAEETEAASSPYGSFSATLTAVSDYRDRGISQTDEQPALQGSLDWAHDSGVYAGVWASNVDFNDGGEADFELDTYLGYATEWAGFDWDFMVNGIFYPGASDALDYDLVEFSASVGRSFDIVNTKALVIYSPDNSGDSGTGIYGKLSADAPIKETGFGLTAAVGHQYVEDTVRYGVPSYNDWSAGVTYSWQTVDFKLEYIDTDLSEGECADGCDATAMLTISHKFGGGEE